MTIFQMKMVSIKLAAMSSELTVVAPQTAPYADTRPAVTVLSGFSPAATLAVARILLATDPSLLLVRYELSPPRDPGAETAPHGTAQRIVRTATEIVEDVEIVLPGGCTPCALHQDILPALVRLSHAHPGRDLLLVLPETVEPESLAGMCRCCQVDGAPVEAALRFDSYVTVVDAQRALHDLRSDDDLRHRDLHTHPDDHRAVAEVVVNQIEYADAVVLWGRPDGHPDSRSDGHPDSRRGGHPDNGAGSDAEIDRFEVARLATLLHRLAPWATHVTAGFQGRIDCTDLSARLRHSRRHDPSVPGVLGRALEGFSVGVHEPTPDCGVVSVLFQTRRPLHPVRLHQALQGLAGETLRSRGQTWIASQPDTAVSWESAGGGISLGSLGYWLAALPEERWSEATQHRLAAASVDWDPYYGDRRTALAFIGVRLDASAIVEQLTACLLTDAEIADGFDAWTTYDDPFAGCFPLE